MKTWKIVYDKYKFDESLERGIRSEGSVILQADAMRIDGGVLLFGTNTENVAAFAEGQWDYVMEVPGQ